MNPELQRNLWLEFSLSRAVLMAGALALIFGLAWYAAAADHALGGYSAFNHPAGQVAQIAEYLFLAITVLWGSFKAGRSVSDEIRERT
jgi:hypothetical protein